MYVLDAHKPVEQNLIYLYVNLNTVMQYLFLLLDALDSTVIKSIQMSL